MFPTWFVIGLVVGLPLLLCAIFYIEEKVKDETYL